MRRETAVWHETYKSEVLARRRRSSHARKLRRAGVFDLSPESRILDVCCGEGEMLELLAREGFSRLTGLDLAPSPPVSGARRWGYVAASATAFPFKASVFDYVLCAHSLHHLGTLSNIESLLRDAYHCLKPGGQLTVIDHYDAPQVRLAFAALFSPLAGLTRFTRLFRQQHLEEREFLYEYLDHWPQLEKLLNSTVYPGASLRKGLFFFYWKAFKRGG